MNWAATFLTMNEPSKAEETAIAQLATEYDLARRQGVSRSEYLARWPNARTQDHLLVELIRIELEDYFTALDRLSAALQAAVIELHDPDVRLKLCRGIYNDLVESRRPIPWNVFVQLGFKAAELDLRAEHDDVALGQTILNKYQLVERIAAGNFGVVFRAIADDETQVAIKIPRGETTRRLQQATALFEREIAIHQRLDCQGIPHFVDSGYATNGVPVMVMEWLEGRKLSVVKRESLSANDSAKLVAGLAQTVDELHRAGIIHRDITPANILVSDDNRPTLIDLGVSLTEARQFESDGEIAGTLSFMPPESLLGMSRQLDGRADIWSLGAILYELLGGKPVSQVNSREEALVQAVIAANHTLEFPDDVSESLRAICQRCLAREPNDRFNTAGELAAALHATRNSDAIIDPECHLRLVAWRMGMKFGAAVENHASFRKYLSAQKESGEDSGKALKTCLGYAVGVTISVDELIKLAGEAGITVSPSPYKDELWTLFYGARKSKLTEHAALLDSAVSAIDQHLDGNFDMIASQIQNQDRPAAAFLNLAARATLALLTRDGPDLLVKFADDAELPALVYMRFTETLRRNASAEEVRKELARLDKLVEKFLLRGAIESIDE